MIDFQVHLQYILEESLNVEKEIENPCEIYCHHFWGSWF